MLGDLPSDIMPQVLMPRDYFVAGLTKYRVIDDVTSYEAGQHLPVGRVSHYIADDEVSVANLMV